MPSIASIFRPKIIRRVILTMFLVAPIIYLFGTQVGALAGAHGKEVLVESGEIFLDNRKVDYNQRLSTGGYSGAFRGLSYSRSQGLWTLNGTTTGYVSFNIGAATLTAGHKYYYVSNLSASNGTEQQIYLQYGGNTYYSTINLSFTASAGGTFRAEFVAYQGRTYDNFHFNSYLFDLTQMYGENASLDDLTRDYDIAGYNEYSLSRIDYFEEYGTPNYRESLFYNMFGRSNFLTEWGSAVLEDRAVGFEPVNALLQYVGGDMLHLGDSQIGLMALGYSTYVFNVLIVYMLVSLCSSLICLPLKVTDIFNRGENL